MTRARYQQISLDDTPYYHCVSRCVRRAYLCGDDPVSGQNFNHRRQWLVTRIKQLSAQFAIDVCAYAIMSNHYHLVLFVNQDKVRNWSDAEVIRHWTALFPRNAAIIETLRNNAKSRKAQKQLVQQVQLWRERLADISWFMRCLNESVARKANKEDDCKGRFWEGRFKSQALLDEKALVTCMAYVDLNPIRAGMSDSLDSSDFTSIQERLINHAKKVKNRSYRQHRLLTRRGAKHLLGRQSRGKPSSLKPLSELSSVRENAFPFSQRSYFELLETTSKALSLFKEESARAIHILEEKQSVLQAIGISAESWIKSVTHFHRHYGPAAGAESSLVEFHNSQIRAGIDYKYPHKWIRGVHSARLLYGT
ncbi:MAG: transposase [Gammaproteobacteria bacterium]|nr:transposase [Gammaproteobacteria bacterium]MDD9894357.1 transposase [Gammaproteobacteria bacterium]MDD9957703.1 transposase [Gammaproteobacteria bacterium]